MIRVGYFLRRAIRGMRQALFVNVVAVLTIAIALFVVAVFGGAVGQVNHLLDIWATELVVAVYLDDDVDITHKVVIKSSIRDAAGDEVTIQEVSKSEAMERLRSYLGPDADILDGLASNPLPASLEVRGGVVQAGFAALQTFAEEIEEIPGVVEVDFGRDWIGRLEGLVGLLRLVGIVIGGLVALAAIVTVSNTIKLAVFARKDEIEIMKLCGATDAFVRAPFLIEGLFQGLVGATLAGTAALGTYFTLLPRVQRGLLDAFAVQMEAAPHWEILVWLGVGGAVLGLAGSALALGRFLKV